MTIVAETRTLIQAALDGDPALSSLKAAGGAPDTLKALIVPGVPMNEIGGVMYSPEPPFRRETLVALIVHMQVLRWQRAAPWTPLAAPPNDVDLQGLHDRHVKATVGFACWPGWTDLLDATFTWLTEIAPDTDWAPDQIKEKYATLRFWHGHLPPLGSEIIDAAEDLSGHICEICGAPGALQNQRGWWSTRCSDHKHWRPA